MPDVLEIEIRTVDTKGRTRRLREAGLAPGVVYGGNKPNLKVQFKRKQLEQILTHSGRGSNTLLEVRFKAGKGFETDTVMIRELQRDPIYHRLRHADFYRISLSERINAEVPLTLVGEAAGVKEGGRLQSFLRSLKVECLPAQIPSTIEVRVDGLHIGEKLTVVDLMLPEEIRVLHDLDEPVVGVAAAREEEIESPKPEPEAAEREAVPEAAK